MGSYIVEYRAVEYILFGWFARLMWCGFKWCFVSVEGVVSAPERLI